MPRRGEITTIPGHSPLPPSPLLVPAQGAFFDNPKQPPVPLISSPTPPPHIARDSSGQNNLSTSSFDSNPYDNLDEGVNIPLLPLLAHRTVQLTLTRDMDAERMAHTDVPYSTGIEQRENSNQLPDYPWTATSSIETASDPQRRQAYPSSAEVQRAGEMPFPSPNSSTYFDTALSSTATLAKLQKQHPFAKNFEVPQWNRLTIHTVLCALTYPFLLLFVIMGRGKSLFWLRLFVGAGCGILGFTLGFSLLNLARGVLEAATWATVIHQSRIPDAHVPGVRLKDLAAHFDDPMSSWAALRLLWDRRSYPGADRQYRKFYDSRNWSLWILFFLLNVVLSGAMTFLLARAVEIDIRVAHQRWKYHEVVVRGDLSDDDIRRAEDYRQSTLNDYSLSWTMAPFSSLGELPAVVAFNWKNESVYFSEVIFSQLVPGGSGFGTFDVNATSPSVDINSQNQMATTPEAELASVLRFPRWGIRFKCEKIPDFPVNLVPLSEEQHYTYLFTPQTTLRSLFDGFDLDFPQILEQPLDFSTVVDPTDSLPTGLNKTGISLGAKFANDGVAYSMTSTTLNMSRKDDDGLGIVTIESVLVRLNTTFAPNGTFGTKSKYSVPDVNGTATFIGYDAVVCLEHYEQWILEVYNSSVGFPSSMQIVDKAAGITDANTAKVREKRVGKPVSDPLVKRMLNTTNMYSAFVAGHQNSINQIIKDNGRDSFYTPSPTLVSWTSGKGPFGYTELSEVYYAKARVLADAKNVLPYFAGSGLTLARRYTDQIVTSTAISAVFLVPTIFVVFLLGLISALFVPRLPLEVPRRGLDLYSWLSAFHAHELVAERPWGFSKNMELKDIKDHTAELKFRYVP